LNYSNCRISFQRTEIEPVPGANAVVLERAIGYRNPLSVELHKVKPPISRSPAMPEKETLERAHEDAAEGKSPSTQAGEFVREEMHHVREGKHGAANTKQAIAIGLSKARRAGVKLGTPNPRTSSAETRKKAAQDSRKGRSGAAKHPSPRRSRATLGALKREPHTAASRENLSRQAHSAATRRGSRARQVSAERAVRTKGPSKMRQAGKKGARTRARNREAA
jgi:hypothetical protein